MKGDQQLSRHRDAPPKPAELLHPFIAARRFEWDWLIPSNQPRMIAHVPIVGSGRP